MEYSGLTDKIIGCCYQVYNVLGYGFLESVYEKSLSIELNKAGLNAEFQKDILVYYDGQIVGEFKADILVENIIIVELKSLRMLSKAHEVQLVNYLSATQKDVGLLINFGEKSVEVKRKVRDINYYKNPVDPVNPV
ncbi:MAG: GxxExxY protein [Planctomycetota bacterium]|jgi:GxxExxY protein